MNDEPTFFEPQDWSIIKTSSLLMNDSLSLYDDTAMFNPQEPPVDFGPSYEPPKIKTEPQDPSDGHSYSDWQSKYIDHWTSQDCLYWLIHQLQDLKVGQGLPEFKLERVAHIDGPTLRQMTVDDFNCIFPEHGLELYNRMHLFKGTYFYSHSLHSFDQWGGQEYPHSHSQPHPQARYPHPQPHPQPHPHPQPQSDTFKTEPRTLTDLDTEPSRSPRYPMPSYCSPSESDSGYKSDSSETTIVEQPPPPEKRRPGRPRGSKRKKKPEKLGRLWEFIRDLLLNPHVQSQSDLLGEL